MAEGVVPDPMADLERRELSAVIDEEILRLPWRYRRPVVLCYLEGLTRRRRGRWVVRWGTVNSRLATARQRLRVRLSRRGLAPSGMLAGIASLPAAAKATVPAALLQGTLRAALRVANRSAVGAGASTTAVAITEGLLRTMISTKIRVAVTYRVERRRPVNGVNQADSILRPGARALGRVT
jgi:hypothetical protein